MLYELRTYTVKPNTLPEFLTYNREIGRPIRGDRYGTLVGSWTTEIGPLNQYVHLWRYEDAADRERVRAALAKDERWTTEYVPKIRPLLVAQENMLLHLDEEVGLSPVEGDGHVYELRTYRLHPGQVGHWMSLFKAALPTRQQYSKIVGLWSSEVGALNTVCHLWYYDDLKQRAEIRAGALKHPVWTDFVRKGTPSLAEMRTTILLPTDVSPLR